MNQPLAYIHPNARIAEDVKIEAFAWIGEDVEIGSGTWIGPNATIMDGARIGKNCKIFPGAVISAIPQDLKYKGETTYCYIGGSVGHDDMVAKVAVVRHVGESHQQAIPTHYGLT